MNIIFLDVDGVLNSYMYYKNLSAEEKQGYKNEISDFHLQMLAKIYQTCNAKIVLSSTWRQINDDEIEDPDCKMMYQYLVESLAKYGMEIMDRTPIIGMDRPKEILGWLLSRPDRDSICFVSLDDDFPKEAYEQYGIGDHLVQTKYWSVSQETGGLQQEHVDQAIRILKMQEKANAIAKGLRKH